MNAVKKTYRGRTVLDFPAFAWERGRVYAVIGANGCGKSTLCKLVAGVTAPDSGSVAVGGSVGYMPQTSYAFALSVRKNVLLSGGDPARADTLLAALGMTALQNAPAHRLSGGETEKMALARVLMRRFDLLVLDEPTASMDTESTLAAERLIAGYARDRNAAVLLVTHAPAQAARIADEVLFLENGALVEHAPPKTLLASPADPRTARFLAFCGIASEKDVNV